MLVRALCVSMLLLVTMSLLRCDGRALKRGGSSSSSSGPEPDDGYSFLRRAYSDDEGNCEQLPPPVLTEILGPAFNPRYMSIEEPPPVADGKRDAVGELANPAGKRDAEPFPPFYVDDKYSLELSHKPAWEVKHVSDPIPHGAAPGATRSRRDLFNDILDTLEPLDETDGAPSSQPETRQTRSLGTTKGRLSRKGATSGSSIGGGSPRPWECEAKIRWIDLGPEYFPRFLRTVECTRQKCWYGHYSCQPRSFTVKILRRRTGECVQSDRLRRIGVDGLPGELRELWVWEERAVNFCCDCAPAF